ncbi:MAG: thioredoxin family protein [Planctomycetales bacterium]
MRQHRTRSVLVFAAFAAFATAARAEDEASLWQKDYETARREAERLDRPLLLHFHADWCPPCRSMERNVLTTEQFKRQITDGYVAVRINSDHRPDLIRQFGVQGLPSDVFIDHTGRILTNTEGEQSLSTYLDKLASVEARYARDKAVRIAANAGENGNGGPKPPAAHEEPAPAPIPSTGPKRIGLEGYSPVVLAKSRKWVKGSAAFAAEHKEIVYQMATAEELAEFRKDPEQYAPRNLGCDLVILHEKDLAVAGSTKYGAYFDSELFLFVDGASREKFKKSPIRYTRTRHVLNVKDILDGDRRTAGRDPATPRR